MMRNCDRPEIKHFDEEDESELTFTLREVQDLMALQAALVEPAPTDNTLDRWADLNVYRQIRTIRNLLAAEGVL
jgi:hypothetical protein